MSACPSEDKTLKVWPHGGHALLADPEQEEVRQAMFAWFTAHIASPAP